MASRRSAISRFTVATSDLFQRRRRCVKLNARGRGLRDRVVACDDFFPVGLGTFKCFRRANVTFGQCRIVEFAFWVLLNEGHFQRFIRKYLKKFVIHQAEFLKSANVLV